MDRRDFLTTAAAGIGVASTQGCAAVLVGAAAPGDPFSTETIQRFLTRFDGGLAAIDAGDSLPDFPTASRGAESSARVKRALRSLYAVGTFADLELEQQAHPAVQERMFRLLPEMELSLRESRELAASISGDDAARIRELLRTDPSLPLRLSESIDAAGQEAGVSAATRRKFRAAATQVTFRLRHHDPTILAGEYVAKARKIEAAGGEEAHLRRIVAARVGQELFLEREARFAAARNRWTELLGSGDGVPAHHEPWAGPLRGAAWCFGLGLVAGGVAALMIEADAIEGLFMGTVAVVLIVIGVVLLLAAGLIAIGHSLGEAHSRDARGERGRPAPEPDALP